MNSETLNPVIETTSFKRTADGSCKIAKAIPDQISIKVALSSSKKEPQKSSTIIIGRYKWLIKNKLIIPNEMELPNLCLVIKDSKLIRAFYSNELTHIIKKQKYFIQVLN